MSSKSAKTSKTTPNRDKGSALGKPASKRMTTAQLAQNLKSIEARLKRADTKNRTAIKALEGVVEDVKRAAKTSTTAQKSALTKGLNLLEIRMETYLERAAAEARAGVRSELASVTASNADSTTLEQALEGAHARLDSLDSTQREALARLNRHIAGLATSVERRLTSETKAREASSAALDAKIDNVRESFETRVEKVELDTAAALTAVGDKITEFTTVLEERAKTSDVETAERLADLAKETTTDFTAVHSEISTRLEALEMIAANWSPEERAARAHNPYLPANSDDPRIDQMGKVIEDLQHEIDRMHARMAGVTVSEPAIPPSPPTPERPPVNIAPPANVAVPINVVPMPNTLSAVPENPYENPYAAAVQTLDIASPLAPETLAPVRVPEVPIAPEVPAPPQINQGSDKAEEKSHIPQEFVPTQFEPPAQPIAMPTPIAPPAALELPTVAAPPPPPPMASAGGFDPVQSVNLGDVQLGDVQLGQQVDEPLMPAPLPISTYADPAYAEGDEMRAERIGVEEIKRKRKSLPLPAISGRNLRAGALAVGVSVVGLLAAKTILGSGEGDTNLVQTEAPAISSSFGNIQPADGNIQSAALGTLNDPTVQSNAATPPLGQYSDMRAPNLEAGGEDTLDAAVRAGNPIAQFQKGLVQLRAGQTEEGARLIRLAANRNQPAAQYRLAKLYESGTGVAKDPVTARELIQRSAAGGNRIAMHDLGNYYAYGQGGLDRDIGTALEWFTKAAERGVVDSQFNVAFLREGNEGIPADLDTALFWYHIAARQGDQGAPDRIRVLGGQVDAKTIADIKARADRFNPKPVDEAANGVFRDVPWTKKARNEKQAAVEITKIRDTQTLLGELGYDVGTPDGIIGSKTRKAIKSFESVNGLPETGQISDDLVRRLEIASGA